MSPPPSPRPQWLILGGGAVVAEFYLGALERLGWLDDIWVADPSSTALARLAGSRPSLRTLQLDYAAALERSGELGIRAVLVALPNALHEPAVAMALKLGLDVLCEKPLAMSEHACRALSEEAEKVGCILAVGMTRRFLPEVAVIRKMLAEGWLGAIESVEVNDGNAFDWSSDSATYSRPDNAGVVANVGVHSLDLAEYLLGPIAPVEYSDDWRGGIEANATFHLQTNAGIPVRFNFSYTHTLHGGFRIRGANAEAGFSPGSPGVEVRSRDGEISGQLTPERPYKHGNWPPALSSAFLEEFSDFEEAIRNRRPPTADGYQAARTAALIDWAYAHHRAELMTPRRRARAERLGLDDGRIVVTGGTGFVGGHLVEELFERGHSDVVLAVRSFRSGAQAWRFPFRLERANLLDSASLQRPMEGARYVFHLAYGAEGSARVTTEGTRNVVEAAVAAGAESIVVLSTTAVFGDPGGGQLVNETFPYGHVKREYETSKAEAERWTLARASREPRTRIVVLNPAYVYGPGGRAFTELPARLVADGAFCLIEGGRGIVNYVYVKNLVDAILLAAVTPEAHKERFIITDGHTTWRDYFEGLLGPVVHSLPSFTKAELTELVRSSSPSLRDVAGQIMRNEQVWSIARQNRQVAAAKALLERVSPRLYKEARISRRGPVQVQASAMRTNRVPPLFLNHLFGATSTRLSADKARRVLGWTPAVDLRAGQALSRAWLQELGLLHSSKTA